jgi:hypothetical protein
MDHRAGACVRVGVDRTHTHISYGYASSRRVVEMDATWVDDVSRRTRRPAAPRHAARRATRLCVSMRPTRPRPFAREWMDGWMVGWKERRMDGWKEGWMERRMEDVKTYGRRV